MGNVASKNNGHDHPTRPTTSADNVKRKSHLRNVLSSNNNSSSKKNNNKVILNGNNSSIPPYTTFRTTENELLPNKQQQEETIATIAVVPTFDPSSSAITSITTTTNNSSLSLKRTSPPLYYDRPKKFRLRPQSINYNSNSSNSKHLSIASCITTASSSYNFNNKSNISSAWTALSSDPFSHIEVNNSAFTEITDYSTISRKSILYPVIETAAHSSSYHDSSSSSLLPPTYEQQQENPKVIIATTAQEILNELNDPSNQLHDVFNETYKRVQQQNDPYDWRQFYLACHQHVQQHVTNIGIVYLARCYMAGLGIVKDERKAIDLLKSNPCCETAYALGHYYYPHSKFEAYRYFSLAAATTGTAQYTITDSNRSTVAEAQCTLAKMMFQGEGVTQNTNEALSLLMKSAENDSMYAQFLIGVHYERGIDLAQDLEKAKEFYTKSANSGFPDAQAALGTRLVAESNYALGIEWLEKAIQKGNSRAHVQLGILYNKGEGVEQSNDMALLNYKAAAEHNNRAAQCILGIVYFFGRLGRQKNNKEAIRFIKQAAVAGLPYAQRVLGQFYQQGIIVDNTAVDTTASQLDTSRQRAKKNGLGAVRWYKRAAMGKDIPALGLLGKCYEHGIGVEVDFEKAIAYYTKAAEASTIGPYICSAQIDQALLLQQLDRHVEAFNLFSLVLEHGDAERDADFIHIARICVARYHLHGKIVGIRHDPVLAHSILVNIAEATNDPLAHYWLGALYDEGVLGLFEVNHVKALEHFLLASNAGDAEATFEIASILFKHVIPGRSPAEALSWYKKAADLGHRNSVFSVGLCYYKGVAQPNNNPDLDAALEWFEKASRLGIANSMSYVARIYFQLMLKQVDQPLLAQQQFAKAVQWLKRAAFENNETYAQRELGKIYLTGKGLPLNYQAAVDLLTKAAAKNDAEAITFLGDCYHKGTGVKQNFDVAIEHYLRAASLGYSYAYSATAELYYDMGNMPLAYDYYLLASKQPKIAQNKIGNTARMMVARISLEYITLPTVIIPFSNSKYNTAALSESNNPSQTMIGKVEAFQILLELAIQDQLPQAFQPLGQCYLNGKGTHINLVQAIFWFRKSTQELNDAFSYYQLAHIYSQPGPEFDLSASMTLYHQSAALGYADAQYRLGVIYLTGELSQAINERASARWFNLSAANGHTESLWRLSQMAARIGQYELELQYQKKAASLGHVVSMRIIGEKCLKQMNETDLVDVWMQKKYLDEALHYLHLAGDEGDTQSLVLLGKTYAKCTKTRVKFEIVAANTLTLQRHLPSPSVTTHNSFEEEEVENFEKTSLGGFESEEEGESKFQCEEDEKNLAIECFERASTLGDIEATVYAAEAWYEQKQYAAALELFEKAASQGNIISRFYCARYCIEGYGGSQLNPEKGFQELLICANELNCVHAFNTLGQCYENGVGTTKNDQLAFEWYHRAAITTHDSEAYYRIGKMFAQKRIPTTSTDKDLEACKYFDLAVNSTKENHGYSCYELGLYYLKGIFDHESEMYLLEPDVCLAIEYFRAAADLNVQEAMFQLGMLFLNSDSYSLEEQEEGFDRLELSSQLGLREAQFHLGVFYHRGKEVIFPEEGECVVIPQDFEKAYDLFCRSAAQKHPTATYYLGIYHQHGVFVAPDLSIALEQYELAVDLYEQCPAAPDRWQAEYNLARIFHDNVESQSQAYELFQSARLHAPQEFKLLSEIMIAKYHLYGWANITVQAKEAATTLIRFATKEDQYHAYLDVAYCFERGIGVEEDLRQAFYWYGQTVSKAHLIQTLGQNLQDEMITTLSLDEGEIENDEAIAMFKLAEFYRQGLVVEKNTEKADALYRLAAKKGSEAAKEFLSPMH